MQANDLSENLNLSGLTVPHIDQYFGVWAIVEDRFREAVARVNAMDLREHVEHRQSEPTARSGGDGFVVAKGGVAVIEMTGPLMKHASSLSGGTSTIEIRRAIRNAATDDDVSAIMLRIDSPGGTVAGTADLAADVASAAKQKPVHAFIEDLGASAAYWIASQATAVLATESSLVGSIGTFSVIHDLSGSAAQQGIKVHVVRAGSFKGSGTPGTEVTTEQLVEVQRVVDGLNSLFLKGVASGRGMSIDTIRELADGRVHGAAEAKSLGLIDGVKSFDKALAALTRNVRANSRVLDDARSFDGVLVASTLCDETNSFVFANPRSINEVLAASTPIPETNSRANAAQSQEENKMRAETTSVAEPKAANIHELKKAFPDATAQFHMDCLEMGATVADAKDLWIEQLGEEAKAAKAEAKAAKEEAKAAKKVPGNEPLGDGNKGASGESDPSGQFRNLVQAKQAAGMPRHKAYRAVARENPELTEAFNVAYTEDCRKARRAG